MGSRRQYQKTTAAVRASSEAGTEKAHGTKRKEATIASSETDHHNRDRKRKQEPSASEDAAAALIKKKKVGDSLFKEGEMLKQLREEFWEAERLWREKLVPGALDRYLKRKQTMQQAPALDGKKKVARVILPDGYLDYMIANPDMMRELSDEEMAECPERFRQKHAIIKVINAKNRAYQQALMDQYRAFGFAYDEKEVTDDKDNEEVVTN